MTTTNEFSGYQAILANMASDSTEPTKHRPTWGATQPFNEFMVLMDSNWLDAAVQLVLIWSDLWILTGKTWKTLPKFQSISLSTVSLWEQKTFHRQSWHPIIAMASNHCQSLPSHGISELSKPLAPWSTASWRPVIRRWVSNSAWFVSGSLPNRDIAGEHQTGNPGKNDWMAQDLLTLFHSQISSTRNNHWPSTIINHDWPSLGIIKHHPSSLIINNYTYELPSWSIIWPSPLPTLIVVVARWAYHFQPQLLLWGNHLVQWIYRG